MRKLLSKLIMIEFQKETHEDFQEGYKARMSRVKDRLHEYVDIDLPVVEDEENW